MFELEVERFVIGLWIILIESYADSGRSEGWAGGGCKPYLPREGKKQNDTFCQTELVGPCLYGGC